MSSFALCLLKPHTHESAPRAAGDVIEIPSADVAQWVVDQGIGTRSTSEHLDVDEAGAWAGAPAQDRSSAPVSTHDTDDTGDTHE